MSYIQLISCRQYAWVVYCVNLRFSHIHFQSQRSSCFSLCCAYAYTYHAFTRFWHTMYVYVHIYLWFVFKRTVHLDSNSHNIHKWQLCWLCTYVECMVCNVTGNINWVASKVVGHIYYIIRKHTVYTSWNTLWHVI